MKVVMLEDIDGKDFLFKRGEIYKALDGDKTDVNNWMDMFLLDNPIVLKGKIGGASLKKNWLAIRLQLSNDFYFEEKDKWRSIERNQ